MDTDQVNGIGGAMSDSTVDHNTVQRPTLANGVAIYGGADTTATGNLVADPVREGSALHVGARFGAEPCTGSLRIEDNTTARAGTYELNWNIGLGATCLLALDRSIDRADVQVVVTCADRPPVVAPPAPSPW